MKFEIVETSGTEESLARVFVARLTGGALVEFAESTQPPYPREDKWVLIVSTLKGCPVKCPICDAGGAYAGKLGAEEILAQIDYLVRLRYPGRVECRKFKVQFARMGDPAFNPAVLTVLKRLPGHLDAPGLMPCISTIAPHGCDAFFRELLAIKHELYGPGRFQMQFSLHTTSEAARPRLVPARTWSFQEMAAYGSRFFEAGDRKLTLNFAPVQGLPLDPEELLPFFTPERFMIKLTPVNPTAAAAQAGLCGLIDPEDAPHCEAVAQSFRTAGYETVLSIGELEENRIGSNCGMLVRRLAGATPRAVDVLRQTI
jgi:23S rRNA (adenine2503-C2)-methyltransferase